MLRSTLYHILILFITTSIHAEHLHTSLDGLRALAKMDHEVPAKIERYISEERQRLQTLKSAVATYLQQYETIIDEFTQSKVDETPLNRFLFSHRVELASSRLHAKLQNTRYRDYMANITADRLDIAPTFPDEHDVLGALNGLFRAQDVYKLTVKDMANGILRGIDTKYKMTDNDLYTVAAAAFEEHDFYHSLLWSLQLWKRLTDSNQNDALMKDTLQILSYSCARQENLQHAYFFTKELAKYMDDNAELQFIINTELQLYSSHVDPESCSQYNSLPKALNLTRPEADITYYKPTDQEIYESLCRGEIKRPESLLSRLTCYYKSNTAFTRLAPFKLELLSLKPKVLLYREILYGNETDELQKIAKTRFVRSGVVQGTDSSSKSEVRVSQVFYSDNSEPLIQQIRNRTEQATDLDLIKGAEGLQIQLYGLAGHYVTHFDFADVDAIAAHGYHGFYTKDWGNRMVTVLFYLGEPIAGGATVFVRLNITAEVSRNDAVMWYNLKRSGKVDYRTLHAGCPVVIGEKWVSNQWIHEYHQEFKRPCALTQKAPPEMY